MHARILIVDDEPDLEALIAQKFRSRIRDGSVSFVFAHDGVEALSVIESDTAIDLVLSDINMPRMDGLTLLGRLQEAEDSLTTVIVSAYGDMENIRTAMNRGAFDFLTKPIDMADLEATVTKTIRHVERQREARARQATAERAHAALSRFFSPNLAERLAGEGDALAGLASQRREVVSIFTDIESFTGLVEATDPAVLAELLNDYLTGMTELVFERGGTVAKIVGDALHILFGAPEPQEDACARAVACALAIDDYCEAIRARWAASGVALRPTRIGAHVGPAIVGSFGGARFFDYSAYGDTINIAARLEAANKQLGTRICISAPLASRAEGLLCRPVGDLVLRGRTEPLACFEPLHPAATEAADLEAYHAAFRLLEAGDRAAVAAFASLLGQRSDDPLAGFHLRRLLNGDTGTEIALG